MAILPLYGIQFQTKRYRVRVYWNNERVLVGEKVIHWKGWQRVGMIKVADLISGRGEFMDKDMIE